jgi:glutamine synthetase
VVAEILRQFADILEKSKNFKNEMAALVKKTFQDHKRIIFNGNNYDAEWVIEAEKRGLSNLKTTIEALPEFVSGKSMELFTKHGVFTGNEIYSRYEILLEAYCKTINIEALTMLDMVKEEVIPACIEYQNDLAKLLEKKKACGAYESSLEEHLLGKISKLFSCLLSKLDTLENVLLKSREEQNILAHAVFFREEVFNAMSELRLITDELETLVAKKYWPYPSYAEMLYSVL